MTTEQALPREAEEFLASLIGRSPATKRLYRFALAHLFKFVKKDSNALDIRDLRRFLRHLEEEHASKKNTLRMYTTLLRNFLRFLKREDLRAQINAIRPPKTLPMVPATEEIEKMIEAADTMRNKMIIQLLARTGLRIGELVNLDIRDIDLQNLRLVVRSRDLWEPKGAKERVVRMDSKTASLIQKYSSSKKEGRLVDVRASAIRNMIKKIARRVGVRNAEKMTPHRLRHFFACDFLQRGGDIRSLQKLLGHSDLSTTEIYLDYDDDLVSQSYNRVFGEKEKQKR